MLIDFPANPRIDQTYFINDRYWTWNGVAWRVYNITPRQVPSVSWVDAGGANDTEALVGVNKTASTLVLDNYTLNSATLTNGYTEEVYTVYDSDFVSISPMNGSIQIWRLSANRTPSLGSWADGQSMTLMIDDGSAFTITWSAMSIVWVGGAAPTLATTGYTVVQLWKVDSTIYGLFTGYV